MNPSNTHLTSLTNPLITPDQLTTTSSRLDGIHTSLEASLRLKGAQLTQAAGILLHLPQPLIAQAIVIFYRFYTGSEGGSFFVNSLTDISTASLYLTTKPSSHPIAPRSLLNVYAYLTSPSSPLRTTFPLSPDPSAPPSIAPPDPTTYTLTEPTYRHSLLTLKKNETLILRTIAFTTSSTPPHHLALTYLQTLSALPSQPTSTSKTLARRTLEYLNTALLSPQLLYLTHQPNALAVAAIYLAAREVGVALSREAWWEVFDVDREELGFLAVGLLSCENFIAGEREVWGKREGGCPLGIEELGKYMKEGEHDEDEAHGGRGERG
ncbi:uncharacterized protein KY384_000456 [Bacidia gigantensis]|uniref:uncharacterized protein n=1 Tax=Bacidia gigantensis TaxID=2732470 RepID=UPI001D03CE09|nr:uncharacterized protein KY384_000456 [Bacidia gigantensis]KAG8525696.1 hypothetical protein KY384_000456 [Bacidia gigantensis]